MIDRIVARYSQRLKPLSIENCGSLGGFSGTEFWKVHCANGTFLLRRWPRSISLQRLSEIHINLRKLIDCAEFVPIPVQDDKGETFFKEAAWFWQLEPWMRGEANFGSTPSETKLQNAFKSLAMIHNGLVANEPFAEKSCSPAIKVRHQFLMDLRNGQLRNINEKLSLQLPSHLKPIAESARPLFALFDQNEMTIESELRNQLATKPRLQMCLRDVWHDHILFVDDQVSAIVDYGAMGRDSVATDLSRLIGSLVEDNREQREIALAAYQAVRELSSVELQLIEVLDRAAILLSGFNWLRWIFVEDRTFDDWHAIQKRIEKFVIRARRL